MNNINLTFRSIDLNKDSSPSIIIARNSLKKDIEMIIIYTSTFKQELLIRKLGTPPK
jgi:hypothetical protein